MTDEIAVARFNKADNPAKSRPLDAIEAAKKWIESDGSAEHVIVLVGRTTEDGASGTRFSRPGVIRIMPQWGFASKGCT